MVFAVSRMALIAALSAAVLLSAGGLTGPQSVSAAQLGSAQSVESVQAQQSIRPAQSTRSASDRASAQSSAQTISQRAKIVQIAESHLGASYRFGAEGEHNRFDCSGLVYAVYKQAGLLDKIGGKRWGARTYYHWFKRQGLASRTDPKPGDLVIWHKGTHIGIYIGNGEIISAVNKKYDVRIHGLGFVSGFTAYLHVQIKGRVPESGGGTSGGNTGGGNTGGGTPTVSHVMADVDHLPVRAGAGRSFDRIALVDRGEIVKVTDSARDKHDRQWFKVRTPSGKVGWVASWNVKVVD